MKEYNIYCDESCHLENDDCKSMALGAVWCNVNDKETVFNRLKEIKRKHKLKADFEIKWNKVSLSKLDFYQDIINYFFDTDKLRFRVLVVPDKSLLNHEEYDQTHDEFYYKMYFDMLKVIISPSDSYNIYLDLKDTKGFDRTELLRKIINNSKYDFSQSVIKKIQEVRSEEVSILQLADLFIGALTYLTRGLKSNQAKLNLIDLIKIRSGYNLTSSTLPTEKKFNLFFWQTGFYRGV